MSGQMATFNEVVEKHFQTLELYTDAITRAHGKSHPEAFEVRELFATINSKIVEADNDEPNLDGEFTQLRSITDNYTVPKNVCQTYAGVYEMLLDLDNAYHTK